jgi:hypothetical protein
MLRVFLGLLLAAGFFLLLSEPENAVAQKGGNSGTITKVNPKNGAITINMFVVAKKKKELTDKEYFLNDDAKVTINEGGEQKIMTGKDAIKDGVIKEGMTCTFVPDGDLKIKELELGVGKKKK